MDPFIAEPCNTLTSPDGYRLTAEGNRVLACIGGGAVALFYPELLALKPVVNCGGNPDSSDSGLAKLLKEILG